ncbi:MAG TPA: response regulator transcription factor [Ktedonobacteraceae bacterium]|jgi:DNA-binding response OmpR family regulator|nr:response regulator transcription factor [Ktedonobacteraceae bacterium]
MRILVAEDHPTLGPNLKKGLERSRYAVDLATTGEDALSLGLAVPYDLVVLDVLLPEISGFEVCRQLRNRKRRIPILFLTALDEIEHRVKGLDLGGDDYLSKPFAFREFEARVRALLRRTRMEKTSILAFLDLTLDTSTRTARRDERVIPLSSKEYALLEFLMYHPHQVLSRSMIADHVWDLDADHLSNVIDVYIGYLRTKLCANGEANLIQTVRGAGYQLREPEG